MIQSFADKETEKIWEGEYSKRLPTEIQNTARRKLRILNNAQDISDLKIPPANRLEKLTGKLKAYHNIRVNRQWRVVFRWIGNDAYDVEIVDYH